MLTTIIPNIYLPLKIFFCNIIVGIRIRTYFRTFHLFLSEKSGHGVRTMYPMTYVLVLCKDMLLSIILIIIECYYNRPTSGLLICGDLG
jgi:hypothetical protein